MTTEEIMTAALALAEADRLQLAQLLSDSVGNGANPDILQDPDFLAVLEQRCQDLSNTVPWSEVRQELEKIIGRSL